MLASDGLGVMGTLTLQRANAIMKVYYASDFLYISSLSFSKLFLIALVYAVVNNRVHRIQPTIVQGLAVLVMLWTLASLSGVAFQCSLPRPWEVLTLRCFNKVSPSPCHLHINWLIF